VVQIGQFPAYDYFKDGSLYLLDTPGHCVGHLCALVRTTTSPDTFLFLGGDAAHHCGEFRPSVHQPLPSTVILEEQGRQVSFCPCSWYEDLQTSRDRDPQGPLWQPAFGHNMDEVLATIHHMQAYDGEDNIFVILAHDSALRRQEVPFFPERVNDWKSRGLDQRLRWTWISEIVEATKLSSQQG
jgi:glyoxylase-like metal-dependent hydrolase (beta-lactamase superfamily II)